MIKCFKRYFKAGPTGDLSVSACVARADFVNLLAACDFKARTAQCSRDPVTTTTPRTTAVISTAVFDPRYDMNRIKSSQTGHTTIIVILIAILITW